jgi:acyl carrier protein
VTEAQVQGSIPPFERVFEILKNLVGMEVEPDEPLTTSAVESLDVVEWMILVEEELGYEIADATVSDLDMLDLEATPRDVYEWFVGQARPTSRHE